MLVFLVGMPAAGKTTLGRKLALDTKLPFFDTDELIEQVYNTSISSFFEQVGEEAFRVIEREILLGLIDKQSVAIIATGGGLPCFFDNMDKMNEAGKTIYVDTPQKTIISRLLADKNRPLVQKLLKNTENELADDEKKAVLTEYIAKTAEKRRFFYEKAQICLSFEEGIDKSTFIEHL